MRLLPVLVVGTLLATELHAQCADGSPPPCPQRRVAAARPAIDANRIAVLPFRVAGTDTLLGEGLAELLATEFTGENGPRAVDMATVLTAWRRAGGGLRTPLPRSRMLALARDLGAGLVTEGSIVGVGRRMTVSTNLVSVPGGAARGRPISISASPDSIDSVLRGTAAGLISALGGQQRTTEGARFTESPEAMRSYLAGMYAWRRGRLVEAVNALERAMTLDTTFAQATFRRFLANSWALPPSTFTAAQTTQRAFMLRDRLSPAERIIVDAMLGAELPDRRPIAERFTARVRAAELLDDSPEALFLLGDFWLHQGAAIDPENQLVRAMEAFGRAAAIDSSATTLRHMLETAVRTRDTTLMRRILPSYSRTEDTGKWAMLYFGYAILGDEQRLAELRQRPEIEAVPGSQAALYTALVADIPARYLEELVQFWSRAIAGSEFHDVMRAQYGLVLATRGRPAAAERIWAGLEGPALAEAERARLTLGLTEAGEGLDVKGAIERLSRSSSLALQCELRLLRWKQGEALDTTDVPATGACRRAHTVVRVAGRAGPDVHALLERVDSAARSLAGPRGYDVLMLARAWERLGRPDRALRAIRYRSKASFINEAPWLFPEEARLALVAGDTAAAVATLRFYLPLLADAEPSMVPKRDSLRAVLRRLEPAR